MNQDIQSVLDFWFGELKHEADYNQDKSAMWFGNGAAFDDTISERFSLLHQKACENELSSWKNNAHGLLALIILLDQFSRHIYRNQARSFAQDEQAIALVKAGINQGLDKNLFFIQRKFFYMPLMHAESLETQRLSIKMFTQLKDDVPVELKDMYENSLSFAISHHHVIEKFSRFPELNEILGRESSAEELDFLATGKYRFL